MQNARFEVYGMEQHHQDHPIQWTFPFQHSHCAQDCFINCPQQGDSDQKTDRPHLMLLKYVQMVVIKVIERNRSSQVCDATISA